MKFCGIVIFADENPRGENSVELLKEIAAGAEKAGKVLEEMKELLLSYKHYFSVYQNFVFTDDTKF